MPIIKPSTAFKQSADWVSAEVRAYMKDQVSTHVDTVQDVRDNDFEKSRFIFVRERGATYRLDLSSSGVDNGDTVIRDNMGRVYIKIKIDAETQIDAERQAREQADTSLSERIDLVEIGVAVSYESRAQLYADLAYPAGSIGHVVGDSNEAYRGVYKKSGASGYGSWVRIGPLPMVTNAASASVPGLMTSSMFVDLQKSFKGKGQLASSVDLNTVLDPGSYYCVTSGATLGLPDGFPVGQAILLYVPAYNIGPTANAFVPQEIELVMDRRRVWKRRLNQANPSDANAAWRLAPAVWQGSISSGSVNSLWDDGLYTVSATVTELPDGWSGIGLLRVTCFGGSAGFSVQRLSPSAGSTFYYERIIRFGASVFPAWQRWSITGSGGAGSTRWTNGKWNVMGDSITQPNDAYWSLLAGPLGITTARNYGIGGTAIAERPSIPGFETNAMSQRFGDMDDDADLISVLGGTNDFGTNVPLGVMSDTGTLTFYGACHVLFSGLVDKYPTSTIAAFTPLPRQSMRAPNSAGFTLRQYADAMQEVCAYYCIPCCDMMKASIFKPWNEDNRNALMPDGLHPSSPTGHQAMSFNQMYNFLNGL